jgi:hypothetical protein
MAKKKGPPRYVVSLYVNHEDYPDTFLPVEIHEGWGSFQCAFADALRHYKRAWSRIYVMPFDHEWQILVAARLADEDTTNDFVTRTKKRRMWDAYGPDFDLVVQIVEFETDVIDSPTKSETTPT